MDGVLELCHVLIKDQTDSGAPPAPNGQQQVNIRDGRRQGPYYIEREEMAEEQGWVARMVHLFRAESLDVQFEVGSWFLGFIYTLNFLYRFMKLLQIARKHFDLGGERMRFTFPALITSSIKLCRRYKNREHLVRPLKKSSTFHSYNKKLPSRKMTGKPKCLQSLNSSDS